MACHYVTFGHTKVFLNGVYTQSLTYRRYYRCVAFNKATEICLIAPVGDTFGARRFISLSTLSHWYYIHGFDE